LQYFSLIIGLIIYQSARATLWAMISLLTISLKSGGIMCITMQIVVIQSKHLVTFIIPSPLIGGGIKRCFCLTSVCLSDVCLSRTSGLCREQRGIGRLKLAQE